MAGLLPVIQYSISRCIAKYIVTCKILLFAFPFFKSYAGWVWHLNLITAFKLLLLLFFSRCISFSHTWHKVEAHRYNFILHNYQKIQLKLRSMCNFCHMQLRLQNDYVCTAKKMVLTWTFCKVWPDIVNSFGAKNMEQTFTLVLFQQDPQTFCSFVVNT